MPPIVHSFHNAGAFLSLFSNGSTGHCKARSALVAVNTNHKSCAVSGLDQVILTVQCAAIVVKSMGKGITYLLASDVL
jgi:hypothetical protein